MSSEMRELIAKWRHSANEPADGSLKTDYDFALEDCANDLEALLARTEAGADGAVGAIEPQDLARWLTEKLCGFDRKRYDLPVVTMDLRMAFSMLPRLFTHHHDAIGDAEDAKRMDWLVANVTETLTAKSIRGEFPYPEHKTQYVLPRLIAWADFHGQVGFREAIDIAMQAKEAK